MSKLMMSLLSLSVSASCFAQAATTSDPITARPLKDFSTTAFCTFTSLHPSQYIVDNNWDILLSFRRAAPISTLDSLGIPYNKSQLRLLMAGDLLSFADGTFKAKMPIFDKAQTDEIRNLSKVFADSLFHVIEPEIKELITAFKAKGYSAQTYSLIFSHLLDGCIWAEDKLPTHEKMTNHGTWSGVYWAMYDKRPEDRNGTNGYGPLKVNWTDELGYWPGDKMLLAFARCIMDHNLPVKDCELKTKLRQWNLVDSNGQPTIPILKRGSQDEIDVLCNNITARISRAVRDYSPTVASTYNLPTREEASVIFYHEVMWDLLALLESGGLVEKPAILKGEEAGAEHFSDIAFIVLSE